MKLLHYINEQVKTETIIDELLKCTEILREYRSLHRVFYRGYAAGKGSLFLEKQGRVESGRNPMSTHGVIHKYLNDGFTEKFGWPARNGVFVSANISHTHMYGRPHVFFPTNGFKYIWNRNIIDLYQTLPVGVEMLEKDPENGEYAHKIKDDAKEKLDNWIKGYKDFGLHKALDTSAEVMFNSKKFYMLNTKHPDFIKIADALDLLLVANHISNIEKKDIPWEFTDADLRVMLYNKHMEGKK